MFKHFLSSSRTISFLFLILFNFKVFSQDTIDEIIVTADFSERHVKYIPSSISLLDSEYIENSSNQHFEELIFIRTKSKLVWRWKSCSLFSNKRCR